MIPLILDCDPGVDDALALLVALGHPALNLLAVTTVAGNRPVDVTFRNACRLLSLAQRTDVPVYRGCARPMAHTAARCNLVHGEDGLGGVQLPDGFAGNTLHAVAALTEQLLAAVEGTITLVAVGPLTNLAMAEILHPGVLKRAKQLLIMGGAARCPGNVTPHAEFNFYADALAAHTVLNAGATVTLFGLDVTSQAVMSNEWINSLPEHLHCGGAAHQMLMAYADEDPLLHDACPVAFLIEPQLFTGEVCAVAVDYRPGPTEGLLTVEKPARVPNSAVAHVITQVNCENLLALVHGSISRLP